MPVPKKKMSKAKRDMRRANWKVEHKPAVQTCSNCGAPVQAHKVCPSCGFYRGKQVLALGE
ncbi:MAG: 50S ribosomal protein L32 [Myxococcota bacterium]|nr:50S ribosomal protein L32 [Myxococcota bacterium]